MVLCYITSEAIDSPYVLRKSRVVLFCCCISSNPTVNEAALVTSPSEATTPFSPFMCVRVLTKILSNRGLLNGPKVSHWSITLAQQKAVTAHPISSQESPGFRQGPKSNSRQTFNKCHLPTCEIHFISNISLISWGVTSQQ